MTVIEKIILVLSFPTVVICGIIMFTLIAKGPQKNLKLR